MQRYVYSGQSDELINTSCGHPHAVRREPNITYRDEFALSELMSINPQLYEQYLHGWSRSFYSSAKHMEAILAYASRNLSITAINQDVYYEAILAVNNGLHSLPTVQATNVLTELDSVGYRTSSAAGYDYVGEKGPYMATNHDRAIRRAKAIMWQAVHEGDEGMTHIIDTMVPDVGYTRTQLADLSEKTKVRGVWGRAFHYILLEGTTAEPFLKAISENDTFIHIGKNPLHSVPKLLSDVKSQARWIYALDWKQFDATVSTFEIETAFDLIKSKVHFPNQETEACFEISRQLFLHKKIAAPDGLIYWAHKGIPSGSYYTSLVGSIINRLRVEYLWRIISGHGPKICYTQGDDSLSGDDILIKPEQFAEAAHQVGWQFNADKTEYSTVPEEVSFLGRTFQGGLNVRDLKRCLRLLIFPEYPVESGRISAFRALSIAEDAGLMSETLNKIAERLRRQFGVASPDEVPFHFKRYHMQM